MTTPTIGSISTGTLHPADLLDAFAYELQRYAEPNSYYSDICRDVRYTLNGLDRDEIAENKRAQGLVGELQDALSELAPPYTYFGTLDGDSADFGFWPDLESLEEDARSGELLKVSDLSEIPPDWIGPVALVNDHGNLTVGHTVACFKHSWDCV